MGREIAGKRRRRIARGKVTAMKDERKRERASMSSQGEKLRGRSESVGTERVSEGQMPPS